MRKTLFVFSLLAATAVFFTNCGNNSTSHTGGADSTLIKYHATVYLQALENNDINTAIAELNHLVYLDSNNLNYKDSLARYYTLEGNYLGAKKYAAIVLDSNPENMEMLEIAALIDQSSGNSEAAIAKLRKIYNTKGDPKYLYSIAANYLNLESYRRVDEVIEELKAHPDFKSKNVRIDFQANDGGVQFISLDAATYYLEGFRWAQSGNKNKALEGLDKALKINPNFQRAQFVAQQVIQMK